jgi:hypothetical protein
MPWPSNAVATLDPVTALQLNSMHVMIAEAVLTVDTVSVTFSAIPQGFDHLLLRMYTHDAVTAANLAFISATFNADETARYGFASRYNGSSASATALHIGKTIGTTGAANSFATNDATIMNYSVPTRRKVAAWRYAQSWDTITGTTRVEIGTSWWNSIDPITSIKLRCTSAAGAVTPLGSFKAGTVLTLYATGAR